MAGYQEGRAEVLAAWDDLRARTRADGDAVALGPAFRETLDRHGALMKQAASFRARPQVFGRLLAERAGIGEAEIVELGELHARAGRHLRSAKARAAHAARHEDRHEEEGIAEAAAVEPLREEHVAPRTAEEVAPDPERNAVPAWEALHDALQEDWSALRAQANERGASMLSMDGYDALIERVRALAKHPDIAPTERADLRGLLDWHDKETAARAAGQRQGGVGEDRPQAAREEAPREPDWRAAWDPVIGEWNALVERARQDGTPAFYAAGYAALIGRIRGLAEIPELPSEERESLQRTLRYHERHVAARRRVEDFFAAAGRHIERREALRGEAADAGAAVAAIPKYRRWRLKAERLMGEGEAILSDRETCGPHLDRIAAGGERAQGAVFDLEEAIEDDDKELARAEREAQERQRAARAQSRLMLGLDPAPAAAEAEPAREAPVRSALSRLGHAAGVVLGGEAYRRQIEAEGRERTALERTRQPMLAWNRLVERAIAEGVHVIHMDGCDSLRRELDTVSRNFALDRRIARQIQAVLSEVGEARTGAGYVESRHRLLLSSLEQREELEASAAERGVAVPDLADYDAWRYGMDDGVRNAEHILANPATYGLFHGAARGRESLASALARTHDMLREDDRRLAEALAGRHKGESVGERRERIAGLLDDPAELKRLRERRAERRRAGRERRKGRYRSRSMRM